MPQQLTKKLVTLQQAASRVIKQQTRRVNYLQEVIDLEIAQRDFTATSKAHLLTIHTAKRPSNTIHYQKRTHKSPTTINHKEQCDTLSARRNIQEPAHQRQPHPSDNINTAGKSPQHSTGSPRAGTKMCLRKQWQPESILMILGRLSLSNK